jgi:hypothetical protein
LLFEGIATADESWVCYLIESDSMFARRCQEVIPRLRPGISINRVVIPAFFTAWQSIALDILLKGQKYNQKYFVDNIFPSLLNEKKHFSRQKAVINFSVHMDNSMCHIEHRVVDELSRLKIRRALYPLCSPYISLCDFWMFGHFNRKRKD